MRRSAAILLILSGWCWTFAVQVGLVAAQASSFSEGFEDSSLNGSLWMTGGRPVSWSPSDQGSWTHSETSGTRDPGDSDGYFRLRVTGPDSGGSYGAICWIRGTINYNDGRPHVIEFTWKPVANDNHNNAYFVQISDGWMPTFQQEYWLPAWQGPTSQEPAVGTKNLLWSQPLSGGLWYPHGTLSSEFKNPLQSEKVTWSVTISPTGAATLFDGPAGTGTIMGQATLNPGDIWYFRLVIYDATSAGFGAGDAQLNLYSVVSDLWPTITQQPRSQTIHFGGPVTFLVSATGPDPMVYQWQKNGTNLVDGGNVSGATTSTLTLAAISDRDAASYSVIVSNAYGSTTSSNALLTVSPLPFIASQPQNLTAGVGSKVTFTVTVLGAPPFVFQWYFNGTPSGSPTSGPNFSSYTLTDIGTNQAGNYSVAVYNGYGGLQSSNALLTVIDPPSLALRLLAGYPMLSLEGRLSSNFVVEYSTNLAGTNWIILLSLTNLPYSPYLFLDPAGDGQPARFYRAVMQ